MVNRCKYSFKVDWWAGVLFLIIMIPNVIWQLWPPAMDPLHKETATPIINKVASVMQVLMISTLLFFRRDSVPSSMKHIYTLAAWACLLLYLSLWVLYFCGICTTTSVVAMAMLPCLSFVTDALGRRYWVAVVCSIGFFICHLAFAIVNFC